MELYENPMPVTEANSKLMGLVLVTNIEYLARKAGKEYENGKNPGVSSHKLFEADIRESDMPTKYVRTQKVVELFAMKNLIVDPDEEERRLGGGTEL